MTGGRRNQPPTEDGPEAGGAERAAPTVSAGETALSAAVDLEKLEIRLLLEAIGERYGYDFRDYAKASMRRRVMACVETERAGTVSGLQAMVLHQPECVERVLSTLTVHTTSMFRDSGFYVAFRQKVVPLLATYPFVRLWIAGCSSGEEAYSTAILLHEEGLLEKTRIFATDLSGVAVRTAREGIYPVAQIQKDTENYHRAGGRRAFAEYYTARYDRVVFRDFLKTHLVFAQHNLVTDASFNEFHAVLCRNVMIYFQKPLQDKVHQLLYESLAPLGLLALGRGESLRFSPRETCYDEFDATERIYRKMT